MDSQDNIRSIYVDMTPELAQKYLDTQVFNRKLNNMWVSALVGVINRGEWILDGNSIKMDCNGHLIDGQHRLNAVIRAQKTVPMEIKSGFAPEAIYVIDAFTKPRSCGDVLTMAGIRNGGTLSSAIRTYRIERDGGSGYNTGNRLSPKEAREIYDLAPDVWQSLMRVYQGPRDRTKGRVPLISPNFLIGFGAYLVIDRKHTVDRVGYFFEQLCSSYKSENASIEKLRTTLLKNKFSNSRYTADTLRTLLAKTWNAYVSGREIKHLRATKDESRVEFI